MGNKKSERGELFLLGVFGLFVIVYLFDIRSLPMEGKMLSYVLAPFIFGTLLLCFFHALVPSKSKKTTPDLGDPDGEASKEEVQKGPGAGGGANRRFLMTLAGGLFLFLSISMLGFYLGSGLMLLIWFVMFKKIDLKTIGVTLLTPLLLYVSFEVVLDMGLPQGALFEWLGF
jgi:hypothetical protein